MDRIAIVGAGPAGMSAAQEFRRLGFDGRLLMIGAERHLPYRRPPLSKEYLRGHQADLTVRGAADADVTWLLGQAATGLDLSRRRVLRGDLEPVGFDGLVIATGLRARTMARVPRSLGVVSLRGLDDALVLRAALADRPRVVVAGAGFIGSEIAATLRTLDLAVTVVDPDPVPLYRPLGIEVGSYVADLHREHGVDLRPGRRVSGVSRVSGPSAVSAGVSGAASGAASGVGRLDRVVLDDGTVLDADLLVLALGTEPETDWLSGSGLLLDGGVVLGADGLAQAVTGRPSPATPGRPVPGVTAAGDVARWPHPLLDGELVRVEHHGNAVIQGGYAARALLGSAQPFRLLPSFSCHLYDRRLQSLGFTGNRFQVRVVARGPGGRFLAEYRDHGRLVGAATIGYVRELSAYHQRIAEPAHPDRPSPDPPARDRPSPDLLRLDRS